MNAAQIVAEPLRIHAIGDAATQRARARDLLISVGIDEQANLPGTIDTHPNWSRRLPGNSEALLDGADAARRLELLACARLQAAERDQ